MQALRARLQASLDERATSGRLRRLRAVPPGVDFCSNDYLGLARDSQLRQRRTDAVVRAAPPLGSTGSRLISGNSPTAEALEHQLAHWLGFECGLLMGSGYSANVGLLAAVAQRGDTLLLDELAHASLIDGANLSRAKRHKFAHNNLDDLEARLLRDRESKELSASTHKQTFVVIESIYSMDGDRAPLTEIANLCGRYGAALIVDEAHGIGTFGAKGEGLVAQQGLQSQVFACVYTFGKAPGCHGALIASSELLRDYLLNFCRPFIYTTAPAPEQLSTIGLACEAVRDATPQREHLQRLIQIFRNTCATLPQAELLPSESPIQGVVIPGETRVQAIATALQQAGFGVRAVVAPTVPAGRERLRICLHAHNSEAEVEALCAALHHALAPDHA